MQAWGRMPDAKIVAVSDQDPKRVAGDFSGTEGNLGDGGATKLSVEKPRGTTNWRELLDATDIDVLDICTPTPTHTEIVLAALAAGKHVICEKPLAPTSADAIKIATAAKASKGFFMPAMCMRFWPQWQWLKQAMTEKRYGKVQAATFRRVASLPGGWFRDGKLSGGAVLDLHIHDVDFIYHLFGLPRGIFSRGYVRDTGAVDHVSSQFVYDDVPLVHAEGGWVMADGFGFNMFYTVNFERATADFDIGRKDPLLLSQAGKKEPIDCGPEHGYVGEISYFADCVKSGKRPTVVTADDAVAGIKMVEAEKRSIASGKIEKPE